MKRGKAAAIKLRRDMSVSRDKAGKAASSTDDLMKVPAPIADAERVS